LAGEAERARRPGTAEEFAPSLSVAGLEELEVEESRLEVAAES
jgi:hypothetical protein